MSFIIGGIGTEVGKTVISALMCEALQADYWKPVQAGDLENSDTDKLRNLVSFAPFITHNEAYRLTQPMSPHAAAARDGAVITPEGFHRPDTKGRPLISELAGGLMVPLSHHYLTIDLAKDIGDPLILVISSYLGSINHTLLSLDLIARRNIPLAGLVFNGKTNPDSREVILDYNARIYKTTPFIADIPTADPLNSSFVTTYAKKIRNQSGLAPL